MATTTPKFSEKLGEFYLGTTLLPKTKAEQATLYDAADLTTHAVIIGMTGSGKTGLGISLLEEASLDNIPVIAIDPKGDLGNLALNFPERKAKHFAPWLDAGVATSQGLAIEELAEKTAKFWDTGLNESGQSTHRQQALKNGNEVTIYTPGSKSGIPIALLSEFAPPPKSILNDAEAYAESLDATIGGLLGLIGIEADSLSSEHVFLVQILKTAWDNEQTLTLADLIGQMLNPPFDKVGILPLDNVVSEKARQSLAMKLNTLIASPSFASWLAGVPLDSNRLFYGENNRPQTSVLNIAHLNDEQRMFFITLLLNNLINWMRRQQGTSTLRAILYMDEVVGYLPPTANPPSKRLLLLLLKQARAFGIGVVLSTQNPIDLDYKALSNAGTWLIGRLQTAQDRARVTEGLLSAGDGGLNKTQLDDWFDQLGKRQFLLHNVHASAPLIFKTRWAMSYLAGPLSKSAIKQLTAQHNQNSTAHLGSSTTATKQNQDNTKTTSVVNNSTPVLAPNIERWYLPTVPKANGNATCYQPIILAHVRVFYDDTKSDTNEHINYALQCQLVEDELDWHNAKPLPISWSQLQKTSHQPALYKDTPASLQDEKLWKAWHKKLKQYIRQQHQLTLWYAPALKMYSTVGEEQATFKNRLITPLHEARDLAIKSIKEDITKNITKLEKKQISLEKKLADATDKASGGWMDAGLSIGSALTGLFSSRKKLSVTNARRMKTAMNKVGNVSDKREKRAEIESQIELLKDEIKTLQADERLQIDALSNQYNIENTVIEPFEITAKATDIEVLDLGVGFVDITINENPNENPV
ncbi:MAG: ATP-binding protein [Gammaproteobacteria bacterium]|nr:MAG: ATP-binding protein [Gammaproteobacteria bacterium]